LKEVANLTPAEVLKGKNFVATERTNHPDAQWFQDTPLGLFIHWGPESAEGLGNALEDDEKRPKTPKIQTSDR
jgi:hypothetical protein